MMLKKFAGGLAAVAAAVALSACGGAAESPTATSSTTSTARESVDPTHNLGAAAQTCQSNATGSPGEYITGFIEDRGSSITLGTKQGNKVELGTIVCLLQGVKAPSYVLSHIDSTRALDGQQEEQWGHYRARWTYHPDDGLNITLIDTKAASS